MAADGIRFLVVDDSTALRKVMSGIVKSLGHVVAAEAANGQEAVDLVRQEKPEVILLDVNMPVKTGLEALQEIVEIDPEAIVLMLTSVSDMETVQKCVELGASNYILKNYSPEQIAGQINEACAMLEEE